VLTCHSLGYLTCLVEVLFQLDMSSKKDVQAGVDVGNVRTSSISAVSSSMVVVGQVNDDLNWNHRAWHDDEIR